MKKIALAGLTVIALLAFSANAFAYNPYNVKKTTCPVSVLGPNGSVICLVY